MSFHDELKDIRKRAGLTEAPTINIKRFPGEIYRAYLGRQRVGQAQVYNYKDDKVGPDERYIWKSAVHPDFMRQGVATRMYDFIAQDLSDQGLKLVPSPGNQLSDDAYQFWKARDPESIKNHPQFGAEPFEKYVGTEIVVKGRPAVIRKVISGRLISIRYTDVPEGSVNSQSTVKIENIRDQLREAPSVDNNKFRVWFGRSKVVDKQGKPLLVYHGTTHPAEFKELRGISHFGSLKAATIMSYDDEMESPARIFPAYLKIENPIQIMDKAGMHSIDNYILGAFASTKNPQMKKELEALYYEDEGEDEDDGFDRGDDNEIKLIDIMSRYGHDGFFYVNTAEDPGHVSWIPLRSDQIKYAYSETATKR